MIVVAATPFGGDRRQRDRLLHGAPQANEIRLVALPLPLRISAQLERQY